MNRFSPAPSQENMDGVACAAVADYVLAEPYTFVGTTIEHESSAIFYPLFVSDDGSAAPEVSDEDYMVVEAEERVMVLEAPNNRMVVWREYT